MDKKIAKNEGAFMELFNRDPKEVQYVEKELERMSEFLRKSWTDEITTLNQEMKESQDSQKQIEEFACDLYNAWCGDIVIGNKYKWVAKKLMALGYRKIPECVVDYIETYKEGFKEGVEAVQTQLKEVNLEFQLVGNKYSQADIKAAVNGFYKAFMQKLDEICKELVDE